MSAAELGRQVGVGRAAVCHIERGRMAPWPTFRRRAADVLGVDEALLFGEVPT